MLSVGNEMGKKKKKRKKKEKRGEKFFCVSFFGGFFSCGKTKKVGRKRKMIKFTIFYFYSLIKSPTPQKITLVVKNNTRHERVPSENGAFSQALLSFCEKNVLKSESYS